jgi:hypothetical protein
VLKSTRQVLGKTLERTKLKRGSITRESCTHKVIEIRCWSNSLKVAKDPLKKGRLSLKF